MDPRVQANLYNIVGREFQSSNYYQFLTNFFTSLNLPGYAGRMQLRQSRKTARVTQIQNYILSNGGTNSPLPPPLPMPRLTTALEAMNFIQTDQMNTTAQMTASRNDALGYGDTNAANFLAGLIEEQEEEESTSSEIIRRTSARLAAGQSLSPIDYNLP